jgi:hypothetical protein
MNKILLALGLSAAAYGGYIAIGKIAVYTPSVIGRRVDDIYSAILARNAAHPLSKVDMLRSQFNEVLVAIQDPAPGFHTHAEAAAERNSGSLFADSYSRAVGLSTYFVQCSKADVRNGRSGSRSWFWTKDCGVEPIPYAPAATDLHVMIDVDHYVDMPAYLCDHFAPVLLYTFQPEHVADECPNYSYTFGNDNKVIYKVSGGGSYTHYVWNYSVDNLLVVKWRWGYPTVVSYLVDRRPMGKHHEMVLLTPVYRWRGVSAIFAMYLCGAELKRILPVCGEFLRLQTHKTDGVYVSTGRPGEYIQAVVKASVDSALAAIARTSVTKLTNPQVQSFVDGNRVAAVILLEYHRSQKGCEMSEVFPLMESIIRYQFSPANYDPNAKPSLKAFMNPLVDMCYAPDITLANEIQCVKGRIEDVKSLCKMTPFLSRVIDEFLELLIPVPYAHDPTDDDDLYERQNRPSQRRILEESQFMTPKRVINMFLKKEAYSKPNDPRPISTMNGVDKAAYSKYMYALAEHLKKQPWYAFGKSPLEIANRVAEICVTAQNLGLSDYNRFDGRVSAVVREMEKRLLLRFFRQTWHAEILDLHKGQYGMKAYTTLGAVYDQAFARGSGSSETANLNSATNACIAYAAIRSTVMDYSYPKPDAAYEKLGQYGGDDGVTPDVDPAIFARVAAKFGQLLDIKVVKRGDMGVKFLARIYGPEVWWGDANSMCDVLRQLSKFHSTVALPEKVTPLMKLGEKARAFALTDANTPIIGHICRKTLLLCPTPLGENILNIWNADLPIDQQYPNEPREWYMDVVRQDMPDFNVEKFRTWLTNARVAEELLRPPLCLENRTALPVAPAVVRDQVLAPLSTSPTPAPALVPISINTSGAGCVLPCCIPSTVPQRPIQQPVRKLRNKYSPLNQKMKLPPQIRRPSGPVRHRGKK